MNVMGQAEVTCTDNSLGLQMHVMGQAEVTCTNNSLEVSRCMSWVKQR